jgi:hypothetical protein
MTGKVFRRVDFSLTSVRCKAEEPRMDTDEHGFVAERCRAGAVSLEPACKFPLAMNLAESSSSSCSSSYSKSGHCACFENTDDFSPFPLPKRRRGDRAKTRFTRISRRRMRTRMRRIQPVGHCCGLKSAPRYGAGQARCLCRKSKVPMPLIVCGPLKNSMAVRSGIPS